ncbi:isoamylase 1, chloroplastic isoform X2 [Morus notabilis]|uniref:isoamylase 1, chloroplastic isoform X2 n=1 Tax=Morus notabilis TaxID=981085 RepID=UPI000CED3042|nr:isoamylase 1, chloroplastic isoform X2 [Morus notabilis]
MESHYLTVSASSFFYNAPRLHRKHLPSLSAIAGVRNRFTRQVHPNRSELIVKAGRGGGSAEVAVVDGGPQLSRFQVSRGSPVPLGATLRDGGVNFAVFAGNAVKATLCLMSLSDLEQNRVTEEISLDPVINQTGSVWHVFVKVDFKDMLYGYKFDGKFSPEEGHYYDPSRIVLDPYGKAVICRGEYGTLGPDGNCWPQMACAVPFFDNEFDWEGDLPLKYPQEDLIVYEMHVRGFTRHESSGTEFPGTYLGVVEKLHHLQELGVNCIELMPCHEFNELEYYSYNSAIGDYKVNFWGYSTVNYFSPMLRYSSAGTHNCGHDAVNELKLLIREAHKRGIEVIMDVVFNHTAEGNENGPILSFRGADNSVYYMLAPKGEFYNYSGCGNTFNCNHPVVRQFIVDCLSPPLIDMMSNDPILCGVKLIAEAWDAGGLYQVGSFPHWGIWSEWNGKYRDTVRQFIKGTDGFSGALAERLCGSPNLYQEGGRKPWHSINFVCAHDGFTLADLVAYNNKHNLANGEDNKDGENHNNSWNCGQEGKFVSISVKKLRKRQMKNFFLCLMVSQGVPMIYMGDEYGHTKGGNNNTYCHDNYINYFRWDKKEDSSSDFFRFCCLVTKFRRECESLGLKDFPTAERLQWHGHAPETPDWSKTSRFVAFSLKDSIKGEIYVAFNASHLPVTISLPERPGYRWEPLVDTGKPAPYDFLSPDVPEREIVVKQYAHFLDANLYPMLSYSSIILLLTPYVEVSS